jgi:hypothetical protein
MGHRFLMGEFCIRSHEFGMAKPSGFVPVAISTLTTSNSSKLLVLFSTLPDDVNKLKKNITTFSKMLQHFLRKVE